MELDPVQDNDKKLFMELIGKYGYLNHVISHDGVSFIAVDKKTLNRVRSPISCDLILFEEKRLC